MSTINERFRQCREALEQSQESFAQKASRSRSEIKNIEYGKTTPKPEVINAICSAWGIREEWLLYGEVPMSKSLIRQAEIARFVGEVMNDAKKQDAQRVLAALMDTSPEELEALVNFARRLAAQYKEKDRL